MQHCILFIYLVDVVCLHDCFMLCFMVSCSKVYTNSVSISHRRNLRAIQSYLLLEHDWYSEIPMFQPSWSTISTAWIYFYNTHSIKMILLLTIRHCACVGLFMVFVQQVCLLPWQPAQDWLQQGQKTDAFWVVYPFFWALPGLRAGNRLWLYMMLIFLANT